MVRGKISLVEGEGRGWKVEGGRSRAIDLFVHSPTRGQVKVIPREKSTLRKAQQTVAKCSATPPPLQGRELRVMEM
jgi:hypothetical protein